MLRLLLLLALCSASLLSLAQTQTTYSLKDGAFRLNGVTMRLQAGQPFRLEAPLKLNDGSVINPSGILVRKDGTRQLLPEGQAVNLQGVVVNLRDDMQSAQAIEQHQRQVTGSPGETRIEMAGLPGARISAATAQQLQLLERRVLLLQQLTDRLADRTAQALSSTPNTAQYDEQLRALDAQIRR